MKTQFGLLPEGAAFSVNGWRWVKRDGAGVGTRGERLELPAEAGVDATGAVPFSSAPIGSKLLYGAEVLEKVSDETDWNVKGPGYKGLIYGRDKVLILSTPASVTNRATICFADLEVGDTFTACREVFRKTAPHAAVSLHSGNPCQVNATTRVSRTTLADAEVGHRVLVLGSHELVVSEQRERETRTRPTPHGTRVSWPKATPCRILPAKLWDCSGPTPQPTTPTPTPLTRKDLKAGETFRVTKDGQVWLAGPSGDAVLPSGDVCPPWVPGTHVTRVTLPAATGREPNGTVLLHVGGSVWTVFYQLGTHRQDRQKRIVRGSSAMPYSEAAASAFRVVSTPERLSVKVGDRVYDPKRDRTFEVVARTIPHGYPLKLKDPRTGEWVKADPEVTYRRTPCS